MCRLRLLVCLTLMFVSACKSGPVIDTGCAWVRPILVSRQDVLTAETARQILALNESWERACPARTDTAPAAH